MKNNTFRVTGTWEREGEQVPYFAKKIQVNYDSKNYSLTLTPFRNKDNKDLEHMRRNLNCVFIAEAPIKSFLMEIKNDEIYLKITPGQLGSALQILFDNRHIDHKTGEAILLYHRKLHYELTFRQRFINFSSRHYESIPAEAPAPSFKLILRN